MSWQTAIPAGKQRRKTKTPTSADRPAFTLRRCDCGSAILPLHDQCVVCAVNADQDDDA